MKVEIYVEGAPEHLAAECRAAFRELFDRAKLTKRPKVIPCGPRGKAFEDFLLALEAPEKIVLLLVDSEAPVKGGGGKWLHVHQRPGDNWKRPTLATEDSLHFMVESMEAWLLADDGALSRYFGGTINHTAPPPNGNWEVKSKADLIKRLDKLANGTPKERYNKGRDSFKLLKLVAPEALEKLPHAATFLSYLKTICV